MSPLSKLFNPIRKLVAAVFQHDLALRREHSGVRVVLEERSMRPGRGKAPSRAELAAAREAKELELMRAQLAELLNEVPETRHTMRHLVFVEQALTRKGLRALHKLPLDVLQRALEQFDGLVTNWSPVGLASLRSKMAVAIIDRENMDPDAEADAYRTAAVMDASPAPSSEPELPSRSDDDALAAAYAALGDLAPSTVETQGELRVQSGRSPARRVPLAPDSVSFPSPDIQVRALHD
jgi:hypothetical protein